MEEIHEEPKKMSQVVRQQYRPTNGAYIQMMYCRESLRTRGEKLVVATTVSLLLALILALIPSLAQPAYAEPYCDGPTPPPICDSEEDPQPPPSPPSNDNFPAARALSESFHWDSGTTAKATLEVGEPRPYHPTQDCGIFGISNSVWYKVTPDESGTLEATTQGSSFDTVLALYKGSSLSSLQQVACSNDNSIPNWKDHMWAPVSEDLGLPCKVVALHPRYSHSP